MNKIQEKVIDLLWEGVISKITERTQKVIDEKRLNECKEQLIVRVKEKYEGEAYYHILYKILLQDKNLERLLCFCYDNTSIDGETVEQMVENMTQDITNPHEASVIKTILLKIENESFRIFNQLNEPEHRALGNIVRDEARKTRSEVQESTKKIAKLLDSKETNPYIRKQQNIEAIDISRGCKKQVNHFCGRDEEIETIKEIFKKNLQSKERTDLWIYGMGGLGKTQLSRKLYSVAKNMFSYIGWVSCQENFEYALATNIKIDNIGTKEPQTLKERYQSVIEYLNSLGREAILFVDNFNDNLEYVEELEKLLCNVVVTSRSKNSDMFLGYKLSFMKLNDCKKIFKTFYTIEDNEIMNEIIHMAGYLTLAVELLAKTAQKIGMGLQKFYEVLKKKEFDIQSVVQSNWDNDGEKLNAALSKHFMILFNLSDLQNSVQAMYIIKNFSILPYLSVKQEEIISWLELNREENKLSNLVDTGWIQQTSDNEYLMHPVIAYSVRKTSNPQLEDCLSIIKRFIQLLLLEEEKNYLDVFMYLPYGETIGHYFSNTVIEEDGTILGFLFQRLGVLYRINGEYDIAKKWLETANDIIESGKETTEIIVLKNEVYNELSSLYLDMRNQNEQSKKWALRAVENDEKNKEIIAPILKSNSFHNLGGAYIQLGNYEQAIIYENKALEIRKQYFPEGHIKILNVMRNLAMVYRRKGDCEKAYEIQGHVIEELEKNHQDNPDHPDFPVAYNLYSFILKDIGQLGKAIDYQQKAIEIREKNNPRDPKLAINYNNLAVLKRENGEFLEAEQWQKKSIEIDLMFRGANHVDLAEDYRNYAILLSQMKRYDEAKFYFEESQKIFRKNGQEEDSI